MTDHLVVSMLAFMLSQKAEKEWISVLWHTFAVCQVFLYVSIKLQ